MPSPGNGGYQKHLGTIGGYEPRALVRRFPKPWVEAAGSRPPLRMLWVVLCESCRKWGIRTDLKNVREAVRIHELSTGHVPLVCRVNVGRMVTRSPRARPRRVRL